MSTVAFPLTKPAGARPPFGGAPPTTTFDSSPDEGGDPISRRLAESVKQVLRACWDASLDDVPMLRRLIEQRRRAINQELNALRMLEVTPMPPLLANFYSLDFLASNLAFGEGEAERLYVQLLEDLDEAEAGLPHIPEERNE